MARWRTLKGLPHNIVKSYLSTLRYHGKGYMGDWLYNAAKALQVETVILDVMNARIEPAEMEKLPLMYHLTDLKNIITTELTQNGFDSDFITQATIEVKITSSLIYARCIKCFPEVRDKNGHIYKSSPILEPVFEQFDPF